MRIRLRRRPRSGKSRRTRLHGMTRLHGRPRSGKSRSRPLVVLATRLLHGDGRPRSSCGRSRPLLAAKRLLTGPLPDAVVEHVGRRYEVPSASSVLAKLPSRVVGHGVPEVPVALRAVDDENDVRHRARGATGVVTRDGRLN